MLIINMNEIDNFQLKISRNQLYGDKIETFMLQYLPNHIVDVSKVHNITLPHKYY